MKNYEISFTNLPKETKETYWIKAQEKTNRMGIFWACGESIVEMPLECESLILYIRNGIEIVIMLMSSKLNQWKP